MSDHVVVDGARQIMLCKHCGTEKPLTLPQTIQQFVADSKKFSDTHNKCIQGFTPTQISMMAHTIGLSNSRKPYRNYYCTSGPNAEWENLVSRKLAQKRITPEGIGGHIYYHLEDKGLEVILNNPQSFDMDKRIKTLKTLERKCNR